MSSSSGSPFNVMGLLFFVFAYHNLCLTSVDVGS